MMATRALIGLLFNGENYIITCILIKTRTLPLKDDPRVQVQNATDFLRKIIFQYTIQLNLAICPMYKIN